MFACKRFAVGLTLLVSLLPALAQARVVHYFTCTDCHRTALDATGLSGVCLKCHDYTTRHDSAFSDGTLTNRPQGFFTRATDESAVASPQGTSHRFTGGDLVPAAGAAAPTNPAFYGTWRASENRLTCSRCHNPHEDKAINPLLLKMSNANDQMCLDCHAAWNRNEAGALLTHPVGVDYATATNASNDPGNLLRDSISGSQVQLVAGKVSCSSCHGVHYVDSHAGTLDGMLNRPTLTAGDGNLLRGDGPTRSGATGAETAQLRSNLCQSCHVYKPHGNAGEQLGCLACHSGHAYNGGSPNYYVLRGQVTTSTFGAVSGLTYASVTANVWQVWADNNPATADGYCEKCHGNLPAMAGSLRQHAEGENCRPCHQHNGATYAFEASGCDGCHGYPPRTLTQGGPDGYAYDAANGYNYSAQPFYKPENATPHSSHAGGFAGYNFGCAKCHNNTFATTHDKGSFQNVLDGATFDALVSGSGALIPAYATAGSGTCSNVACHSNGGKRTGDGPTRAYTKTASPTWAGSKNSLIGAADQNVRCSSCHGNSAATMALAAKDNSPSHLKHLNKGYACNVCHKETATGATALAAGAAGGKHVDGAVGVVFDGSYNLGAFNLTFAVPGYTANLGTCGVYCHSDGKGTAPPLTPDWDSAASGACGACHKRDVASGAPMTSGSHGAHINDADNEVGRNLGCADCHSNTVSDNATIGNQANHVNGAVTLGVASAANQASCASIKCHSNGNLDGTLVYKTLGTDYIWGTTILAGCDDCHGDGAGKAYPTYANGGAGVNANSHAAHVAKGYACGECHSGTATGNALKTGGTLLHVNQTVEVGGAQIGSYAGGTCNNVACHGGGSPQWGAVLTCSQCHLGGNPDVDNFVYNDGTTAAINSAEWTYSGHGTAAIGLAGANPCLYCHSDGVSHGAANLFRLRTNTVAGVPAGNLNTACLGCHGSGGSGVDPDGAAAGYASKTSTRKVDKYHGGAKHGLNNDGGSWCWDCHDPHGDASAAGQRIKMIQRRAAVNPDVNGIPASLTATDIVFTDNTVGVGAGAFARDAAPFAEGVCNNCHTATAQYTQTTGRGTHGTGKCSSCHKHSGDTSYDGYAFKGGGCNGCHGDTTSGNFWPDAAGTSALTYPDRAGLHLQHVNAIGDQIAGGGAGSATLNHKNATCGYCHPDPGGANVNGNSHDTDTTGSPASTPDLHKDGWNPSTSFTNLQAGVDANGAFNPTIKRCSTVDCHSNGEFTWTWYPDVIAPGQIVNLAAATGSEPGTVELTWTPPANDGAAGPNAYHYEVRYGAAAIADANWASAIVAGGPPSMVRRGKLNASKMKVDGLAPGTSYFFAVKTADEDDNWSTASNSVSAVAKTDTQAPVFLGLGQYHSTDETGTVALSWEAAQDHSLPVTYTVYYDSGTIEYSAVTDTAITTTGTTLKVSGLPTGVLYNFAVRAKDSAGNSDTNTIVKAVLPKTTPKIQPTTVTYYTGGTTVLQTGTYGTAGSGNATFRTANFAADTNIVGTSFYANFNNSSETVGGTVTADLGYWNGVFNPFVPAVTVTKTVPPNTANKVLRLGFGAGGMVPAGSGLALRITVTGATVSYGSATNRGDITVLQTLYNHLPAAFTFAAPPSGSGVVNLSWNAATDADGHTVHYDVVGSDDNGATFKHLIAEGLTGSPTVSVAWDTRKAGIGLSAANAGVMVKVLAMDGYQKGDGSGVDHTALTSAAWTVNNSVDTIAPGQIKDLVAETRPKSGSAYLTWTAPGDDGYDKTRAAQYDIRYSTAAIGSDAAFGLATPVTSEPVPTFGGTLQGFEVVDLVPDTAYYFAIKAADEAGNWSALSDNDPVAVGNQSPSAAGGRKCGICHGTPPDDATTAGNHIRHGYTVPDCVKCHGEEVATYGIKDYNTGIRHQDGLLQLGFGRDAAGVKLPEVTGTLVGDTITYTQGGLKIYEDTSSGGFTASPGGDRIDNGTCFNFANLNASGCHGPATPSWDESVNLPCASCHGNLARASDPYGQPFDNAGNETILASPPVDNHGGSSGKYVGQHEKHLNYSFRYAKGDNCRLCHKDNSHASGTIDIKLDLDAAGAGATFTPGAGATPGTCAGTSGVTCHGTAATPQWSSAANIDCVNCHQFGGTTPSHVTDPAGGVTLANNGWASDPMPGNCTYCHLAGHPSGTPANTVLIPNNSFVGISYSGGGIHLRTNIGGRGPYSSEAEMCWGCHDSNNISEWGSNNKALTGSSPYNYGTVNSGTSAKWIASPGVGASWTSANFTYKTGAIQSTHTTSPAGSSAVTLNTAVTPKRYQENVDAVANIRCTNCHDVHNRNLAANDTSTGSPYLRGTWKGNPYEEDGAPQSTKTYTGQTINITHTYAPPTIGFGAVPRGSTQYRELGGYYIDQNNVVPGTGASTRTAAVNPTAGWTVQSSAGLCILCHGDNVDALDQKTGENLWLGTNGHSNAVLGSTAVSAANIFDYTHGRPTPNVNNSDFTSESFTNRIPNMANQRGAAIVGDLYFIFGYRRPTWTPAVYGATEAYAALAYDWGATVDAGTTDKWFHQFSCSKCHNPHASRLPKLMITNCLDIVHNTWDDNKGSQTRSTASTTDYNKKPAYYASAQNCHRRDSSRNAANFDDPINGGWNKVTPW